MGKCPGCGSTEHTSRTRVGDMASNSIPNFTLGDGLYVLLLSSYVYLPLKKWSSQKLSSIEDSLVNDSHWDVLYISGTYSSYN